MSAEPVVPGAGRASEKTIEERRTLLYAIRERTQTQFDHCYHRPMLSWADFDELMDAMLDTLNELAALARPALPAPPDTIAAWIATASEDELFTAMNALPRTVLNRLVAAYEAPAPPSLRELRMYFDGILETLEASKTRRENTPSREETNEIFEAAMAGAGRTDELLAALPAPEPPKVHPLLTEITEAVRGGTVTNHGDSGYIVTGRAAHPAEQGANLSSAISTAERGRDKKADASVGSVPLRDDEKMAPVALPAEHAPPDAT